MEPILYLAPLHGITNYVFRNVFFKYFSGFDYAMAPFIISVKSLNVRKNHIKDLLPENNNKNNIKIIPQILSNNPDDFILLYDLLENYGYKEVNWNLGCPYSMVANKIRGSGLLPYPDKINHFLESVYSRKNILMSVKLRLGRFDYNEIFKLIPVLNIFPLTKVIIHPRIGIQMYKGEVNLDVFFEAVKLIKHIVVYNGDIKDKKSFDNLKNKFNFINEWMVGRYAISNPFIAGLIKDDKEKIKNKKEVIRQFHGELYENYKKVLFGPKHVMDKMKEIWSYLSLSFGNQDMIFKNIIKTKNIHEYNTVINDVFINEEWIK